MHVLGERVDLDDELLEQLRVELDLLAVLDKFRLLADAREGVGHGDHMLVLHDLGLWVPARRRQGKASLVERILSDRLLGHRAVQPLLSLQEVPLRALDAHRRLGELVLGLRNLLGRGSRPAAIWRASRIS